MEVSYPETVFVVARMYFPFVSERNFHHLFKLSVLSVGQHMGTNDNRLIRNFLILLYWARHYPSFETLGAIFGLSDTQCCDIVHSLVQTYASNHHKFVNLNNIDLVDDYFIQGVAGNY